jgi:nucleoid-associated protein YgaU
MGLFDFVKSAGTKIFGKDEPEPEMITADSADAHAQMNAIRAKQLASRLKDLGLDITGLTIKVDGETATLGGTLDTQENREKVILTVGNVAGISKVDDNIQVEHKEPAAVFYTVKSGDTLSKIAKEQYGNANKYNIIFEANRPMLENPDKIYPGQVLRIPALTEG